MGLTAAQAQQVISMINPSWEKHAGEIAKAVYVRNEKALDDWESAPEYASLDLAWEKSFGTPLSKSTTITGYSSKDSFYVRQWATQSFVKATEGRIPEGDLHKALARCGYEVPPPIPGSFQSSTQAKMLTIALRTTKKNWGALSPLFSELAINVGLATNQVEVGKAVNDFMDGLK